MTKNGTSLGNLIVLCIAGTVIPQVHVVGAAEALIGIRSIRTMPFILCTPSMVVKQLNVSMRSSTTLVGRGGITAVINGTDLDAINIVNVASANGIRTDLVCSDG